MILQILSALLVFTMILEIPKKYMLYASASGAVGWWAYLMVQNSGHSSMLAAFLSTLVVAFLSHILARVKKAPVTVFLITGTLPAVPPYTGAFIISSRTTRRWLQKIFWRPSRSPEPLPWGSLPWTLCSGWFWPMTGKKRRRDDGPCFPAEDIDAVREHVLLRDVLPVDLLDRPAQERMIEHKMIWK